MNRVSLVLLGPFRHRGLGQEQHARDGYGVFERETDDLCGVDDAGLYQIDEFLARGVEADAAGRPPRLRPPRSFETSSAAVFARQEA